MVNAGLCLQILSPAPGQTVAAGSAVTVRVQVALACGCPAGAGGRYDYRRFEVKAALHRGETGPVEFDLAPGSGVGELTGRLAVKEAGDYLLTIEACDPESGMAGRAKTTFRVR
jgi:hypothetical protein